MQIEQIRSFLITADSLSFTKAAEELYVTQSVLSKRITSVEQQLNVVLFERNKTGIRLTPTGVVAYERFSKVMHAYESAIYHISNYQEHVEGAILMIKLAGLKTPMALQEAITEFTKMYPNVSFRRKSLNNNPVVKSIRDGQADVYLTWKHDIEDNPAVEYIELGKYNLCIATSTAHPLVQSGEATIEMYKNDNWIVIMQEESRSLNKFNTQLFCAAKFEPRIINAHDFADMLDLIEGGVGVGIVSEGHVLHGASSISFTNMPTIPPWTMVAAFKKDNKNPISNDFLSILKKQTAGNS